MVMQQALEAGLMTGQESAPVAGSIWPRAAVLRCLSQLLCHTPRSRRVSVLVLGIIVLSLADLFITLAYLKANWMMEANPLAAWIIQNSRSPLALALFKIGSVGVCAALLYRPRHHRSGEVAAWCALAVLILMSVMWHDYASHFDNPEAIMEQMAVAHDDGRLGLP
jgi:hypothetical protein